MAKNPIGTNLTDSVETNTIGLSLPSLTTGAAVFESAEILSN